MQFRAARDGLTRSFIRDSAHLHAYRVEANAETTTQALGVLEEEHLPAFTFEVFHLLMGEKPGFRNTHVNLGNLYLKVV